MEGEKLEAVTPSLLSIKCPDSHIASPYHPVHLGDRLPV